MKLADRELIYDEAFKVYIGRAQFRSTDGALKFSETWYAEFYLDGKQRSKALGVRTRLHAIKEAQKLADSLASGDLRVTERAKMKLGDIIEKYLAWQHLNDRSPKTLEKYEYVLREQFKPWWQKRGDKPAATFKADDYLAFKKMLADEEYEPKTIADRLMIVRQLFKWAATRCDPPLLPRYPLLNVELMKVPEKQQPCFSAEQVRQILEHAPADERPIYATFAYTGMRFGEARDLKWTDIDFRDGGGTIYIRRGGSRKDMTKSGKSRPVPMTAELNAILSGMERRGDNVFSLVPMRRHDLPQ